MWPVSYPVNCQIRNCWWRTTKRPNRVFCTKETSTAFKHGFIALQSIDLNTFWQKIIKNLTIVTKYQEQFLLSILAAIDKYKNKTTAGQQISGWSYWWQKEEEKISLKSIVNSSCLTFLSPSIDRSSKIRLPPIQGQKLAVAKPPIFLVCFFGHFTGWRSGKRMDCMIQYWILLMISECVKNMKCFIQLINSVFFIPPQCSTIVSKLYRKLY